MIFSPDDPVIPVGFAAPAAEQILVMHCLREDSLLGREGFSARAASNRESSLLEWALALDHYELPLDMKSRTLLLTQTPRRLALVPAPGGRVALVHSAYLAEDTCHRPHSFVSHVLIYPRLDMLQAAAAWGSSDWQTDEYERGATQLLPPFNGVPRADLINDAALTAFLEGSDASADQSLARVVFPSRVDRKAESRRRWLRAVLHAFLRIGEPNASRPRVCILAEPGVVALLVYAIARLLPSRLVGLFPFSTYEPPHTSFRENKIARVVGSYARDGLGRADNTLRRRAYVIDTIQDDCGPELMVESSWPLEGLVKLAAAGDWSKVDELRELWAADTQVMPGVTPAALAETLRVQPLVVELRNGVLKVEGLSELRRTRLGEGLLRRGDLRSRAWEVVRQVWTRPEVQKEFGDLLSEHLDELFADLQRQIESSQDEAWRADWDAFELLVPVEQRAEYLTRLLESLGTTAGARTLPVTELVGWLHRWSRATQSASAVPTGLFWLLQTEDESTFRTLIGSSKCEPRHAGLAACLAFAGWADGRSALDVLKHVSDDQFREFVTQLERFSDRDSVFARVVSDSDLSRALVGRLIQPPSQVSPGWFEELLSATRCDDSNWHKYWLKEKRLEGLLKRLGISSALSRRIWDGLVARITPDNFDDSTLSPELETLCAAARRFPATLSPEQQKRLIGWETLSTHFASPQNTPETRTKLTAACEAVGQTFDSLAERWLHNHVDASHDDLERKRHNERLARALRGFHENEDSTCGAALKLAQTVRDPNRRRLSTEDLFRAIVSNANWNRLVQRHHREIGGTSIALLPLSRTKGHASVKTGKRFSLGRLRLSPEFSRILIPFLSGCAFTAVLLLVLWYVKVGDLTITWIRPDQTAENTESLPRLENKLDEPESQLAQQKRDLGDRQKQFDKTLKEHKTSSKAPNSSTADRTPNELETTTAGREATVYPPGPQPADAKEPVRANQEPFTAQAKPSAPSENSDTGLLMDLFNSFVLDPPLKDEEDFSKARNATTLLGKLLRGKREALSVSAAKSILEGLSVLNVPTDVKSKLETDEEKSDFAFLNTAKEHTLTLATLRSKTKSVTCYQLDLQKELSWKVGGQQASIKGSFDSIVPTMAGDRLVLKQTNEGSGEFTLVELQPDQLFKKEHIVKEIVSKHLRRIELIDPSTKFAINNRRGLIAFVRSTSEQKGKPPSVVVRKADGKEISPDFEEFRKDVEGSEIKEMSFDQAGEILIIGFKGKRSLLAFPLTEDRPKPKRYPPYPRSILGWSCSPDNRLAVFTQMEVFIEDLTEISDKTKSGPPLFDAPVPLRCVAFSPKGTMLATGDDDGVVTIRLSDGGKKVLRLAHEGPILKLGFSPNGRVLAALGKPQGNKSEAPQGIIRLWVTKNWDQNVKDPIGTSPAAEEKRPDESRRRDQSEHLTQSRVSPAD